MIKKKVTTQKITMRLLLSLSPLWVLLTKKDTSRTFFFFAKKKKEEEFWGENSLQKKERVSSSLSKYNI